VTLTAPLAPYLHWAKTRPQAAFDLAGSNLLACSLDDLPEARDVVDLSAANDNGNLPLVQRVAAHYRVDIERVALGSGCSGANFLVVAALAGAGDDVLVERPAYDPLLGACALLGARVRRFDRRFDDGYALDIDALRAALTSRTRLIVVSSPHNPSGVALDAASLLALGQLARERGCHVLVDEVYRDAANLVGNGQPRPSAAGLDGPFVVTSSLTKSYGLAGLRCGWAIAPAEIAERIRRVRDLIESIGAAPAERLSVLAFDRLGALGARARTLLEANLHTAHTFFDGHPQLEIAAPLSTSICFPRLHGVDDAGPFVERALTRHGVAVAPGHFFDAPAHFRISLGGDPRIVERGLAALSAALNS